MIVIQHVHCTMGRLPRFARNDEMWEGFSSDISASNTRLKPVLS